MPNPGFAVDLSPLSFAFESKPLLIGGKAMEYYGLRKAGADIDLVITAGDYRRLAAQYPRNRRDIWGDLGVCVHGFEIWQTIVLFDYDYLSRDAVEEENVRVISLDRLLFTRVLAMEVDKYRRDLDLVVDKLLTDALPERTKYLEGTVLDQFARNSDLVVVGDVVPSQSAMGPVGSSLARVTSAWSLARPELAATVPGQVIGVARLDRPAPATVFLLLRAGSTGEYTLLGDDAVAVQSADRLTHAKPESALGRCIHGKSPAEMADAVQRAIEFRPR